MDGRTGIRQAEKATGNPYPKRGQIKANIFKQIALAFIPSSGDAQTPSEGDADAGWRRPKLLRLRQTDELSSLSATPFSAVAAFTLEQDNLDG